MDSDYRTEPEDAVIAMLHTTVKSPVQGKTAKMVHWRKQFKMKPVSSQNVDVCAIISTCKSIVSSGFRLDDIEIRSLPFYRHISLSTTNVYIINVVCHDRENFLVRD